MPHGARGMGLLGKGMSWGGAGRADAVRPVSGAAGDHALLECVTHLGMRTDCASVGA